MRLPSALLALLALAVPPAHADYDPLAASSTKIEHRDFDVRDGGRDRAIPVRVYLPEVKSPAPVVLFSHGLGGTRETCAYLGEHWAARGFVAVMMQHPGSDDAVWKGVKPGRRMAAMKGAASAANLILRARDVTAVLDQLDAWNKAKSHPLAGRLDMTRVGMAGHSFGGATTQAVVGQRFPVGDLSEPRVKAAAVFSPSSPARGDSETAFGGVKIPMLLLTGTHDNAVVGGATPESRRLVFAALPAGQKYQLVLDKAEHSAFVESRLAGDKRARNPNHHRAVRAVTTAFWDAYLRGDPAAKAWLDGGGVKAVIEKGDVWQTK